jgi:nicotinate dehydrogenase large molybdopterin subunit
MRQIMNVGQPDRKVPIGGSDRRIDSFDKVTGQTRYVDDLTMPGMLYAYVLRSQYHHARLLAINTEKAEKMPGVVRIFTAQDIVGENGLSGYSKNEPVLTPIGDTLRQRGAPIALVAARTLEQARQAAAAVEMECEILPHFFTNEAALKDDSFALYTDGNILNSYTTAHGDISKALASSEVLIETEYQTTFQEHSTLEREALLAYLDEKGCLTVLGGTHEPHWQVGYIVQNLKIDPEKVRVILPPTGGSFGSRQDPWPFVAVGLMAYLLKTPVRLSYSRREVFDATPKRHPYEVRMQIGADASGCLSGIRVRINANTGGYDSHG